MKTKKNSFIFFITSFIFLLNAQSVLGIDYQNFSHSQARLISTHGQVSPHSNLILAFDIKPINKWHTYWKNSGDSGSPTILDWKINDQKLNFEIKWPYPSRIETAEIVTFGYKEQNLLLIPIEIKSFNNKDLHIDLNAEWLVCDDVCIPQYGNFSITIPWTENEIFSENKSLIDDFLKKVPKPYLANDIELDIHQNKVLLKLKSSTTRTLVDFYPDNNDVISNQKPKKLSNQKTLAFNLSTQSSSYQLSGVIKINHDGQDEYYQLDIQPTKNSSLIAIIFFSFLGGFILNFMPCVFPILFLKLKYFLNQPHQQTTLKKQSLAYSLGVIVSMMLLAIIIYCLKLTGSFIGWGFQLQSPTFITILGLIFLFLALFSLDWFEIGFSVNSKIQKSIEGNDLINHFFTGVLAVLIASPCTAPFMGAAIGFALTQNIFIILLTFIFLGIGFCFPFLLVCIFPKLILIFPKPGAWMDKIKKIMAIPFLLTVIWLLWILSFQIHWFFVILIILLMIICTIKLYRKTNQPKANWIKSFTICFIILLICVPIASYFSQKLNRSFLSQKNNHQLLWDDFHQINLVDYLLEHDRVFIDFTAQWCLTCQVNDKLVFSKDEIISFLKEKNIQTIKADWTQKDEKIAQFLAEYQRAGIPFYILFYNHGKDYLILPEILTPDLFREKINQKIP